MKEKLFQLELECHSGAISEKNYARQKAGLNATLARLLSRSSQWGGRETALTAFTNSAPRCSITGEFFMPLAQKAVSTLSGRIPKVMGPNAHALADYALSAICIVGGIVLLRRSKRAALGALLCGGAGLLNSLFTDYPGGRWRRISFPTHGRIDAALAGVTARIPQALGFDDERESRFFESQALAATLVAAMTNYDYPQPGPDPDNKWDDTGSFI